MAQILDKGKIHRIFELLDKEISKDAEQPSLKFILVAVGGTSLTLRNIKPSTKDIDLMAEGIELEKIKKYVGKVYEKDGMKIDIWQSPHVFSTTLLKGFSSDLYAKRYKHFDVRLINLVDNAVTKLSRFNEADREDIDSIIKAGIHAKDIIDRFKDTLKQNGFANKEEAKKKLEIFKKIY